MTVPPRLGSCVLPPLDAEFNGLWDAILDLAEDLTPRGWALVGGQMVMLHGLTAGRVATRASHDIDVLADLLTDLIEVRDSFNGSDRKRLRRLDEVLADRDHDAWRALADQAEDGYSRWRLLLS